MASLMLISKKGHGEGCTVPGRCSLRGMGSKGGEVRQSWSNTRGKIHLLLLKILSSKGDFPGSREVSSNRGHPSQHGILTGQQRWALQKGKPAAYCWFLISSDDCIGCLQEFGELFIHCSSKIRKEFCQHVQYCLPPALGYANPCLCLKGGLSFDTEEFQPDSLQLAETVKNITSSLFVAICSKNSIVFMTYQDADLYLMLNLRWRTRLRKQRMHSNLKHSQLSE